MENGLEPSEDVQRTRETGETTVWNRAAALETSTSQRRLPSVGWLRNSVKMQQNWSNVTDVGGASTCHRN